MTLPANELAELQALLDALCEESITPAQLQRLEELVLAHPEAEAHYVQYMSLYADLVGHFGPLTAGRREAVAGSVTEPASPAIHPRSSRSRSFFWGTFGLSAVAAALVLMLGPWQHPGGHAPGDADQETGDSTVAVLIQAPEAEWEDTGLPTRAGAPLPPGWLRLKSGLARLEFYSGATVILEGPAELELISRMEAYCARGKLRVLVPPQAQGFTIGSPKLELVDRGTEFGLEVVGRDKTEVHVFQGKVDLFNTGLRQENGLQKALTTGQGLRLAGQDAPHLIRSNPTGFPTIQDLEGRAQAQTRRLQESWTAASKLLRRDPSLVVYYPFQSEGPWGRTLRDEAGDRQQPHDGAIVGCSWVTGRWPGKQALEFKRVSDRVRLTVPGAFESITLAAWVRVDGLPNTNNSLMMSDRWPEGGLHWQIGENGTLILGVKARGKDPNGHYRAQQAFGPERFGQWAHLAVVYDRDAGQVTHYIDGRAVAEVPVQFDIPLQIGDAELGNWTPTSSRSKVPIRFLTGCMDEFQVFSRALGEGDIERLYTQGRPSS
jgi:hypothetical protein